MANHVSWMDGILMLLSSSRNIRMVAYADYVKGPWIGWLARLFGIIPIRSGDGPRALLQSLNTAREAFLAGELVCIFAEGQVTRNGQLQKFERGLLKILKGTDAPVIPVFLDELWGSIFSYERGKFLWKKPRHWPYPVSISFGAPLHGVDNVDVVRQGCWNWELCPWNAESTADCFLRSSSSASVGSTGDGQRWPILAARNDS